MYLLGLFADDTDSYFLHDQHVLDHLLETIEYFSNMSGLRINYDKTSIYRIGSLKNSNATLYTQKPLNWTNEPVNILGVWIDHSENEIIKLNYESLVQKTGIVLNSWSNRNLSLVGKVQVVNALVASLYVYRMSAIPSPTTTFFNKIQTMCNKFFWNGRVKIPTALLQTNKKLGGLGLVNFESKDKSLKIAWIKNLNEDKNLANLAYTLINPWLKETIWEVNLKASDVHVVQCKSLFWRDVIKSWAEINYINEVEDPASPNYLVKFSHKAAQCPVVLVGLL